MLAPCCEYELWSLHVMNCTITELLASVYGQIQDPVAVYAE